MTRSVETLVEERPTAAGDKLPSGDARALDNPAVVSAATAMLLLDVTVVNVALSAIRADLDASFAEMQWVIDAYALTLAATLLSAGAPGRPMFASSLALLANEFQGKERGFALGFGAASPPPLSRSSRSVSGSLPPRRDFASFL